MVPMVTNKRWTGFWHTNVIDFTNGRAIAKLVSIGNVGKANAKKKYITTNRLLKH